MEARIQRTPRCQDDLGTIDVIPDIAIEPSLPELKVVCEYTYGTGPQCLRNFGRAFDWIRIDSWGVRYYPLMCDIGVVHKVSQSAVGNHAFSVSVNTRPRYCVNLYIIL